MIPFHAALGKPTSTAGPPRVSLGSLGIAPRRLRGSAHSPSSGRKPRPPGRSIPAPRSHSDPARFSDWWPPEVRAGTGSARLSPKAHTPLPDPSRPAQAGCSAGRRSPPPAPKQGSPPPRTSPGATPCPSPRRALVQVWAAGAREDRGGRRRAPSGGRRGQGAGARVPPATPPGGGDGSLGFPPAREGVRASRPRAPFSPRRKHFWMELNFCKKNQ